MKYVDKAIEWLKRPENLGDVLRFGAIAYGALAGGSEFAQSGDAVAATGAMVPSALAFSAGEALRAYEALRRRPSYTSVRSTEQRYTDVRGYHKVGRTLHMPDRTNTNILQKTGRIASALIPAAAAYFLSDGTYNPITDMGPIAAWGLTQGVTMFGDKRQENGLGREVVNKGRENAVEYISRMADDNELAGMIGSLRRKKKV